jgi:hypothetical protein
MPVEFIGMIATQEQSEITARARGVPPVRGRDRAGWPRPLSGGVRPQESGVRWLVRGEALSVSVWPDAPPLGMARASLPRRMRQPPRSGFQQRPS